MLGNHDLHLLAVHCGVARLRKQDTLQPVLEAPDVEELLDWLRCQSMLHREGDYVLVHAGILPQWSAEQAVGLAGEVEDALRSDQYQTLLPFIYRSEETRWSDDIPSPARLGLITNVPDQNADVFPRRPHRPCVQGSAGPGTSRPFTLVSSAPTHPSSRNGDLRALVRLGSLRRRRSDCVGTVDASGDTSWPVFDWKTGNCIRSRVAETSPGCARISGKPGIHVRHPCEWLHEAAVQRAFHP